MPDGGPASLAEDLILLSIRRKSGALVNLNRIDYAVMGAELVALAAAGRADVDRGRIVIRDATPTGDPELDAALSGLARRRRQPRASDWVGRPRRGIVQAYVARLTAAGVLATERRFLGQRRLRVMAPARLEAARARLDAIAASAGPASLEAMAFAGLACAAGLDTVLYPGRSGRDQRGRLKEVGDGRWTPKAPPAAVLAAGTPAVADPAALGTVAADAGQVAFPGESGPAPRHAGHLPPQAGQHAANSAAGQAAHRAADAAGPAAQRANPPTGQAAYRAPDSHPHVAAPTATPAAQHAATHQAAHAAAGAAHTASQAASHTASQATTHAASHAAAHAASQAAAHAASHAAAHAASQAAAHAATHAAMSAATHAAAQAAAQAAHSAAHSAAMAAGHHGGGGGFSAGGHH